MNVEVEIVEERRTIYLVTDVKSLEEAEGVALTWATEKRKLDENVPKKWAREVERFVTWSNPVQYRGKEIVRQK